MSSSVPAAGRVDTTERKIVLAIMEARGLNAADKPMHETMRLRVSASLRGMRERGSLTSGEGKGASLLWRLAGRGTQINVHLTKATAYYRRDNHNADCLRP